MQTTLGRSKRNAAITFLRDVVRQLVRRIRQFAETARRAAQNTMDRIRLGAAVGAREGVMRAARRLPAITFTDMERVSTARRIMKYLVPFMKRVGTGAVIGGGFTGAEYALAEIAKSAENLSKGDADTALTDGELADVITSPSFITVLREKVAEKEEEERRAAIELERMNAQKSIKEEEIFLMEVDEEDQKLKREEAENLRKEKRRKLLEERRRDREERKNRLAEERIEEAAFQEEKRRRENRNKPWTASYAEREREAEKNRYDLEWETPEAKETRIKKEQQSILFQSLYEGKAHEAKERFLKQKEREAKEKEEAEKAHNLYEHLNRKEKEAKDNEAKEKEKEASKSQNEVADIDGDCVAFSCFTSQDSALGLGYQDDDPKVKEEIRITDDAQQDREKNAKDEADADYLDYLGKIEEFTFSSLYLKLGNVTNSIVEKELKTLSLPIETLVFYIVIVVAIVLLGLYIICRDCKCNNKTIGFF